MHSGIFSLTRFLFFISLCILIGTDGLLTKESPKEIKEKNITFTDISLPPASGNKPSSIVVLFHGYGDTAENFIFLAAVLGQFLPDSLFIALDGPIPCRTIPSGRQWLNTPKNSPTQLLREINNLTVPLNLHLDKLLRKYNIPPEKMALVGFSQGARIALHIGLRRPKCSGIVGLSGSFLNDPKAVNLSRPPILLVHGVADTKAPVSLGRESYKHLDALKMPVSLVLLPGVGHDIDPQGLSLAGEFLSDCLNGNVTNKN